MGSESPAAEHLYAYPEGLVEGGGAVEHLEGFTVRTHLPQTCCRRLEAAVQSRRARFGWSPAVTAIVRPLSFLVLRQ